MIDPEEAFGLLKLLGRLAFVNDQQSESIAALSARLKKKETPDGVDTGTVVHPNAGETDHPGGTSPDGGSDPGGGS